MWIRYCGGCGKNLKKKEMSGGLYYVWEDCQSCYLRLGVFLSKEEKFVSLSKYVTHIYGRRGVVQDGYYKGSIAVFMVNN